MRYWGGMKPFALDTDPAAHRVQVELLRRLSPAQRLRLVHRRNAAVRAVALARLRRDYPDDTPRQRTLRLAALRLEDALMQEAFDWDPEREGR